MWSRLFPSGRHGSYIIALCIGLAVLVLQMGLFSGGMAKAAGQPYRVGSQKQLFIDDFLIGSSRNVTLTMNPPLKTGERSIVSEYPWEDFWVGGWITVIEDEGVYKMWYDAASSVPNIGSPYPRDPSRFQCYAVSRDGIHWEKPKLGLMEFQEAKENNIVLRSTTGSVFLDPKRLDGNRFKYIGWWVTDKYVDKEIEKKTHVGYDQNVWVFSSPDGLHWTFPDRPALTHGVFDTQNEAFWDDRLGKYVGYFRMWAPLRKVGRSESPDLIHWQDPVVVFGYDSQDPVESDHYNPGVIKYSYAQDVYLMFTSAYYHYPRKNNDGPLDVQLATSRDGIHWNRLDRRPYLVLGPKGTFDSGQIYMGLGMVRKGNELWMYYTGHDWTHGDYDMKTTRKRGLVSRVVQRLDGFISADAAYTGGELTTVPIIFEGNHLTLNIDTGSLGSARVGIADDQGHAVPGFNEEDCDPIIGNYIGQQVSWKGNSNVGSLAGKVVRLRFLMRSTKLYAFQFGA